MSGSAIAQLLEDSDLVRDGFAFRVFSKIKGVQSSFQAGDYIFQKNLTFSELADLLQNGRGKEVKVTIPEGSTIAQIDEILAKKGLIQPGEFTECANFCDLGFRVDSLEGYLFPSTYYVGQSTFSLKRFTSRLYNTFQQQIEPLRQDIASSGRTLNEIVIMASMIEREAATDDEAPAIADVLWKRYDERIHLGVDATTRYELSDWERPLYTEDFEVDSPYNTRRTLGLPPTAISNPGLEAIRAAVHPEANEYYYYLHGRDGKIRFGKTLEDHNRNKEAYLW